MLLVDICLIHIFTLSIRACFLHLDMAKPMLPFIRRHWTYTSRDQYAKITSFHRLQ